MIVKVVPNRRDGKSSFEELGAYITKGIEQSELAHRTSWDRLTQYITAQSVLDALGDNIEKTIAVEIGNVTSLKTAASEMFAVADRNKRVKNPVYHYILSWPENERPDIQDIMVAARHTLKALGLLEHQYIIAIHDNTDNLHAHIEVNRVSSVTYLAPDLAWDRSRLHKAAREVEVQFGWRHDKGIYEVIEVNGHKHIVKNENYVDPDLVPVQGPANRFETWSGEQSLESWCRGDPASELKRVLAEDTLVSWQDLHRALALFGLELRDRGGGGMQVVDVSGERHEKAGRPLAVSASKAFRFLKRSELEKRLGTFEAHDPTVSMSAPVKTYKRDPLKRLDRRLARKVLRDALHDRFKEEQRQARLRNTVAKDEIKNAFRTDETARYSTLYARHKAQRLTIREDASLTAKQKQQAYSLLSMTMLQAKEQIKQQIHQERADRKALIPSIPVWRGWVEQQAQLGDEGAISALRGLVYQEKRELKKAGKDIDSGHSLDSSENAIRPAIYQDSDPYVRAIQNIVWKVTGTGRVIYSFKNGSAGFIDQGDKLTFERKEVTDEALKVTLRYAKEKWGTGIHIAGGDMTFKMRTARLAQTMGMTIKNTELQYLAPLSNTQLGVPRHLFDFNNQPERSYNELYKPYAEAIGSAPPPAARTGLRSLSDLAMVHHEGRSKTRSGEVLLSSNVSGQLELGRSQRDKRLRRLADDHSGGIVR